MRYQKAVHERDRLKSHLELQAQLQVLCREPCSQPRHDFVLRADGKQLPIDEHKTVWCDLASPLCVITSVSESTAGRQQRDLELQAAAVGQCRGHRGPGLGVCHVLLYPSQSRRAQLPAPAALAVPINL